MARARFGIPGSTGMRWVGAFLLATLLLAPPAVRADPPVCTAGVCTVETAARLVIALTQIDATPGTYTINITQDITLTAGTTLPAITGSANDVTINGGGFSLN